MNSNHGRHFNPYENGPWNLLTAWTLLHGDESIRWMPDLPDRDTPLIGDPSEVLPFLHSSRSYRLWQSVETLIEKVDPAQVLYTQHSDYQWLYPKDDSGMLRRTFPFPGKRSDPGDGYLTGWDRPIGSDVVSMRRHPELPKFVITNGNHRVMKSKLGEGPAIHAEVAYTTWSPLPMSIMKSLACFQNEHPDLAVEQILPYPTKHFPGLIVFRLRPQVAGARSFLLQIDSGHFDSNILTTKAVLAARTLRSPRVWFSLLKSIRNLICT